MAQYGSHTPTGELSREEIIVLCYERAWQLAGRYGRLTRYTTAEDLVQDAMVRVMLNIDRAMTKQEPGGYLYCVARNAILDALRNDDILSGDYRTNKHEPVLSLDVPVGPEHEETLLLDVIPAPSETEDRRDWSVLYAMINQMTPLMRQTLSYRFGVDGCEPAEIPSYVESGTLRYRVHYAMRVLRKRQQLEVYCH